MINFIFINYELGFYLIDLFGKLGRSGRLLLLWYGCFFNMYYYYIKFLNKEKFINDR